MANPIIAMNTNISQRVFRVDLHLDTFEPLPGATVPTLTVARAMYPRHKIVTFRAIEAIDHKTAAIAAEDLFWLDADPTHKPVLKSIHTWDPSDNMMSNNMISTAHTPRHRRRFEENGT